MELMEFGPYLHIKYEKGSLNVVADALSRKTQEKSPALKISQQTVALNVISNIQVTASFLTDLKEAYHGDELTRSFLTDQTHQPDWFVEDGLIFTTIAGGSRPYIPDDAELKGLILKECHSIPIAGHLGRDKTLSSSESTFYWPHLPRDVALYVQRCVECQQAKSSNQRPSGLHTPLDIPERR